MVDIWTARYPKSTKLTLSHTHTHTHRVFLCSLLMGITVVKMLGLKVAESVTPDFYS